MTLVPEFAVEDMPLGRTAALVPEFAVKDLPLAEHTDDLAIEAYVLINLSTIIEIPLKTKFSTSKMLLIFLDDKV